MLSDNEGNEEALLDDRELDDPACSLVLESLDVGNARSTCSIASSASRSKSSSPSSIGGSKGALGVSFFSVERSGS